MLIQVEICVAIVPKCGAFCYAIQANLYPAYTVCAQSWKFGTSLQKLYRNQLISWSNLWWDTGKFMVCVCPSTANFPIWICLFFICDIIKGNESLVENFNFNFLTPLSHNFKMLNIDVNPIIIGYLVTELWAIYQY